MSVLKLAMIELERYNEEQQWLEAYERKKKLLIKRKRIKLVNELYSCYKMNSYTGVVRCPCGGSWSLKSFNQHCLSKKHIAFIS